MQDRRRRVRLPVRCATLAPWPASRSSSTGDPGHDDALAIALALARPELDVLAITTVAGNAPLDRTTRNALGS